MPKVAQQFIDIGPLKALVVENNLQAQYNLVLLHGYGANALNLYPLHRYIPTNNNIRWIFPEGPKAVYAGPPGSQPSNINVSNNPLILGKAWFDIDTKAIEKRDFSFDPKAHADSKLVLKNVYQALKPFSQSHLIIGGFSQGAMLATYLTMTTDLNIKGLIVLSGALFHQDKLWEGSLVSRQGLPFFQSHGYSDDILNYTEAKKLEVALQKRGLQGHLFSFEGGHEIPEVLFRKLQGFLNQFDQ